MEPEARNQISNLYHRALERPPEERRAFLQQACDGDEVLRQEVESLLRYESVSPGFLERPANAGILAEVAQIGEYNILEPLGVGGMGEVYRAHDSKLGRDVAIKILPSHFIADPERRARFAREARLLATLNHPHIGSIYGLEEAEGVTALVLELVEGPTLADRLERGPLPVAEALAIARQVASALDEAHEKGIIHRDLKPANIVLQGVADGGFGEVRAKVLDFGLAKTLDVFAKEEAEPPIASAGATADGRILGTPAYMSPEQARGLAVDKRTDVWAFGCVLFEMLSGRRPFDGDTVTDTFAHILEREPEWNLLPAKTPPHIRSLIECCLRKNPRKRLHDIADALIQIDSDGRRVESTGSGWASAQRIGWILFAALALAWAGVALWMHRTLSMPPAERVVFSIAPPVGSSFSSYPNLPEFAISPDGSQVVFVAWSKNGSSLWLRSMATVDAHKLPDTEGARNPFWSPDSKTVGFFANGSLKRVLAAGGSPAIIWRAAGVDGSGTWNDDGVIVFGPVDGVLRQVSLRGGAPTDLTAKGEDPRYPPVLPSFLPDGIHFVFHVPIKPKPGERITTGEVRIGSLLTSDNTVIGPTDSQGIYAAGHLFFVRGGHLTAQPFDVKTGKLSRTPLDLNVDQGLPLYRPSFSVASTGRVVYAPPPAPAQLTWVDRQGKPVGTVGDPGFFLSLDLSPDGKRVAVSGDPQPKSGERLQRDVWVIEVATGRRHPITNGPTRSFDPTWSPDGRYIAFNSDRPEENDPFGLFMRPSEGPGEEIELAKGVPGKAFTNPDWSKTNVLVYNKGPLDVAGVGTDIWTLQMTGARRQTPFLETNFNEQGGSISPNGRFIAYESNESGRAEVYVRPYPGKGPPNQISRDGGHALRWRGNGAEIFFLSPDSSMMAAKVDPNTGQAVGDPVNLFATQLRLPNHPYAVDKNGERFLLPIPGPQALHVVMDWGALIGK